MKQRFASAPVDLGHGYSVEFTFRPGGILCEWSPRVPDKRTPQCVFDRYAEARNAFVAARLFRFVGNIGPVKTELRG